MREIKNIKEITSVYKDWTPSDIAFIKGIELFNDNLIILFYSQLRKEITGWPDITKRFFEISITFQNIQSLKLELDGVNIYQISGFDIINVSGNGLENMNYQIEDYENDSISFYCEDIVINRISNPCLVSM